MERDAARDRGLAVRMTLAVAGMALVWAAILGVLAIFVVAGIAERSGWSLGAGLLGLGAIPLLLYVQYHGAGQAAVRILRAKGDPLGEPLVPVLARLAAQADVEAPELLVAHARAANALAAFRPGKRSAVIVTTGLLQRLKPAELEAVLAHELSHLTDRDAAVMTVVGGPALACSALWHARNGRASSIAILLSPLWLVALLLMLVVARGREYAADRGSALLTGRPEQLISALTKLHGLEPQGDLRGGTAVRALCIVGRHASRIPWLRDHPPIEKRIAALEEIARELGQPSRPGWTGH